MESSSIGSNSFLRRMLTLAIPITLQSLITSSLSMIDSMMVGQLGVDSIAAVGIGNKITTILILILQGFGTGAAIFVAQYFGKKDLVGIQKVFYLTVQIVVIFSLLFTAIILFFTSRFIQLFTTDRHVIEISLHFLRIMAISYLPTGMTIVFMTTLKSMGEVKRPLYISILAIGLNTLLNYAMIFGHFGFPEMGVEGAAYATLIARVVQMILLFLIVCQYLSISLKTVIMPHHFDRLLAKKYVSITIPTIINHVAWTLGETSYFWVYAQMGTEALAAVTIIDPLVFIFMALFIGLGDASQVMVGNSIGANKKEAAFDYAKRFIKITFVLSMVSGIFIILFIPLFLSVYNVIDTVSVLAKNILIVYAFLMIGKMLNLVNNVGVLRAGGDTKFVMYLDMIGVWCIGFPLAMLGAFWFRLPVYIVFALANSHDIVRAVVGIKRTFSKKWIRSVTEHYAPAS